jgi:hypothetical protein
MADIKKSDYLALNLPDADNTVDYDVFFTQNFKTIDTAINNANTTLTSLSSNTYIPVVFQNAWINYGNNYAPAGYVKDKLGFVTIKGMIFNGIMPGAAFVLPAGYRPSELTRFAVQAHNGTAVVVAGVEISPTGNVTVAYGGNTWVILSGIRFLATL